MGYCLLAFVFCCWFLFLLLPLQAGPKGGSARAAESKANAKAAGESKGTRGRPPDDPIELAMREINDFENPEANSLFFGDWAVAKLKNLKRHNVKAKDVLSAPL